MSEIYNSVMANEQNEITENYSFSNLNVNLATFDQSVKIGSDFVNGSTTVTNDNVVKGWYFASKIEVVDAATHKYKVCVSTGTTQKSSADLRTISVSSATDANVKLGLSVGNVLSMRNDKVILNALKITAISGNCITYQILTDVYNPNDSYQVNYYNSATEIMGDITAGNPKDFNEHTIWCLRKPTIGVIDIVKYNVIAGGWGCKNYGNATVVSGRQNTIYADYGVAFGRNNTSGYACITSGQSNANHKYSYSNVFGFGFNTTNSYQSLFGIGNNTTIDKDIFFGVYTNEDRNGGGYGALSFGVYHKYIMVNGTKNLLIGGNINTDTTTGNKIGTNISRSIIIGSNNSADTGTGSVAQNMFVGGFNNSLSSDTNNTNISNSLVYGQNNNTSKANSITLGKGLINKVNAGCVVGQFNKESSAQFIVGGGTSTSDRKNLFEVNSTGFIIPLFNEAGIATGDYVQIQAVEDSNGSIILKPTKIPTIIS